MTVAKLLLELLRNGIQVWVEGDELCLRAPKGALTPTLREELSRRKQEIIDLLEKQTRYAVPSFAQQRMWLLDQLEPDTPTYNMRKAVRLNGTLDVGSLRGSLKEIFRRHEALRTRFEMVDGTPVQVISPPLSLEVPLIDLGDVPQAQRGDEAKRLAREEARRPFDLERGPLVRAKLVRLDEEEHLLLLTMHHIVSDGWSMGVFWRELMALYEAFAEGKPSPLAELPIQYADYAVWQRQWLSGEVLEEQLGYWKEQLAELPVLELPTDRPRPAVQTHRGDRRSLELSREVSAGLKELARREGTTLFMVLLGAFQVLLSRYSGQEDVAVGTPIAGRNRSETEGLIGFFVNTLVMRTDLSGDPSFKELLGRVREVALGAYDHQDLPFEKLVEELQPERDLSRTPLFQVFFNMQDRNVTSRKLNGITAESISRSELVDQPWLKFDLTLHISEVYGGLHFKLVYNTDLFDEATIERMLEHFRALLEGVVADPERPISGIVLEALPLTSSGEVDGRALPAPEISRSELEGRFVAPRDPLEEQLAGIWSEVLEVEPVGINDNFFESGGHSLLAMRVISRVREVFGVELPLISFFEEPTITGLALTVTQIKAEKEIDIEQMLQERAKRRTNEDIPTLPRHSESGQPRVFPLSSAQRWMWFNEQKSVRAHHNMSQTIRLYGPLDVTALEASLHEICTRHEALRTTFGTCNGEPVQIVGPPRPISLTRRDLRELTPEAREAEASRLIVRESRRPFDLSRDLLLRATLVRVDDEEHVLLLVMHHIASDGQSVGVLFDELSALYNALRAGRRANLPELPVQYVDYVVWQWQRLQDWELRRLMDYWKDQLADAPVALHMPAGQPSLWPLGTSRSASVPEQELQLRMPSRLLQDLQALCRRQNVTLFMTLLATWTTLLHRYSGEEDILISTNLANRKRLEVERSIGCFASFALLLRHDLSGDPSFTELLKRVRKTTLDAISHSELPVEILLKELYVDCDIGFRLQTTARSRLDLDGLKVERVRRNRGRRRSFLALAMTQGDEDLTARLDYNSNIFEAATIQQMLGDLQSLLEGIVADPGQPISRLPLLAGTDRPVGPTQARSWFIRFRKGLRWSLRQTRRRAGRFVRAGQAWPLVGGLFARIEEVSGSLLPPMVTEPFRVPSAVPKRCLNQTQADSLRGK